MSASDRERAGAFEAFSLPSSLTPPGIFTGQVDCDALMRPELVG